MKVLLLTSDAYGGHGGIALYNRCLAEALVAMPEVTEVVVVPRGHALCASWCPGQNPLRGGSLQAANGATCAPCVACRRAL